MPIRIKLVLPGLLILLVACGMALWRDAAPAAWLVAAATGLVALQLLVNERWVMGALRAIRATLAGRSSLPVHAPEWREVMARIAGLQTVVAHGHSALERVVSQSRQMEDALQLSEQRYGLAVRGANDGLWEWDLSGRRVSFSPRWRHMFGLDDAGDAMSVEAWRQRLHPADRRDAIEALDAHLRGGTESYEHPHRLLHADGRYRWVLSRGTALRRASGTVYRVVGLDTDITKIKRVETIIEAIANGTAGQSGETFFKALVQNFAHALHIDCAFITECTNRPATRARTLAFWRAGAFDANFEYELEGTPCDRVIREGRICFHREGLADLFPAEDGHESYLGLPIHARDGIVIGHLAFLDTAPMPGDMLVESVYRIFTARAGVEIELGQALRRLAAVDGPVTAG